MIKLIRDSKSAAGTHGRFILGGNVWHTIEQPWRNNERSRSCVPKGDYVLIPWKSGKYGDCFIMVNPDLNVFRTFNNAERHAPNIGRSKCLFVHRGNFVRNFKGCIGASHGYDERTDSLITSTTEACKEINKLVVEEGSYRIRIMEE